MSEANGPNDPGQPDEPDGQPGEPDEHEPPQLDDEAEELLAEAEHVISEAATGSDLAAERDEYLEALRRLQAEFENHKKRVARDREVIGQQASGRLVSVLLPVLDSCDAAVAHGAPDVEPIYKSLVEALAKEGLEVLQPDGDRFDPNVHEAVMHEEADEDDGGESVVAETLRTGYLWQGQVLRPAMVKVRG